ncbi:MAG: hypothetical protein OXG35_32440 [Acidobacteria bacterium]|nr:hypothetical protein [Acidobacteriota bacterium]
MKRSRPFCLNCGTVGYSTSGPEPCPKKAPGDGEWSVIYWTRRNGWDCLKTFRSEQSARAEVAEAPAMFDAELLSCGEAAAREECSRRNNEETTRCE